MAYNGWANYQTWNVALWLGNDEGLYRAALDFAREHKRIKASDAEAFVTELLPNGTPDFDSPAEYRHVRWGAIARDIQEMARG